MSQFIGGMKNPFNNDPTKTVPIYKGFSWPAFFFGCLWLMWKRMWLYAAICFGAACVFAVIIPVAGGWIVGLVLGFAGNEWHQKFLQSEGYISDGGVMTQEQAEHQSANTKGWLLALTCIMILFFAMFMFGVMTQTHN